MTPSEFMLGYESVGQYARCIFVQQSSHVGKDAIRRAIGANFATIEAEIYRISGLTWLAASDEIAVCVCEFDWRGQIDGAPPSGGGRGATMIRRVDGAWRVAHERLSAGRLGPC